MNRSTPAACDFTHAAKFLAGLRTVERAKPAGGAARSPFARKPPTIPRCFSRSSVVMTMSGRFASTSNPAPSANVNGDTVIWVWVGTHNEFDKLFG
jgi:hypothetical protein